MCYILKVRWGSDGEPQLLLRRGAVPQPSEPAVSPPVRPTGSVEMVLTAGMGAQDLELFAHEIVNSSEEPRSAELRVEYTSGGRLMLNLQWLVEPAEEILTRELVQVMPVL